MKTTNFALLLLFLILVCSSCRKDQDTVTNTPGYFVLARFNSESTGLKSVKHSDVSDIDFGDLKASKEFYFLLVNGGDEPIFDISLSTDNASFSIVPSKVNLLSGGTILSNAESTGIIPVLTLGIIHGTSLNGVGYKELLPMGINTSVLTITGKTIDRLDTIEVTGTFNLSVNALVMDIQLFENQDMIDIVHPTGFLSSNLGGLGFIRYYSIFNSSLVTVKNTGNVEIDLYYDNTDVQNFNASISPSDSVTLNVPDYMKILILDSKGTITDNRRIQLGNDGKGYLAIIKDKNN